jgi:hypothetical protein
VPVKVTVATASGACGGLSVNHLQWI